MSVNIDFLPDRLNREPVVFRGMTTTELFMALLAGLFCGAASGSAAAIAVGEWALIPTGALGTAVLFILVGGRWLARLKRGRPDTWLYRHLGAWFARKGMGDSKLVQQSAVWVTRRRAAL